MTDARTANRRYKFVWQDLQGKRYAIKGVKFDDWKELKRFVDSIQGTIVDWVYV